MNTTHAPSQTTNMQRIIEHVNTFTAYVEGTLNLINSNMAQMKGLLFWGDKDFMIPTGLEGHCSVIQRTPPRTNQSRGTFRLPLSKALVDEDENRCSVRNIYENTPAANTRVALLQLVKPRCSSPNSLLFGGFFAKTGVWMAFRHPKPGFCLFLSCRNREFDGS